MKDVATALELVKARVESDPQLEETLKLVIDLDVLMKLPVDDVGDPRILLPYSSDPIVKEDRWNTVSPLALAG